MVKRNLAVRILVTLMLTLVAIVCVTPFLYIVAISISSNASITANGYQIIPSEITFSAYQYLFRSSNQVFASYGVTIFVTLVGTTLSVLLTSTLSFALSRKDFRSRGKVALYIYITMLFNGGTVSSYILISQYLHLKNNILVLILPLLISPWNVFMLRTFFQKVPDSLFEAAKIDGAGEFKIFFIIALPLVKTGIAIITLFMLLAYWNDWFLSMLYITNDSIISLQYLMYRIVAQVDFIQRMSSSGSDMMSSANIMDVSIRMALCVVAAGPMIIVFVFFQKYFAKGITIGAVKE